MGHVYLPYFLCSCFLELNIPSWREEGKARKSITSQLEKLKLTGFIRLPPQCHRNGKQIPLPNQQKLPSTPAGRSRGVAVRSPQPGCRRLSSEATALDGAVCAPLSNPGKFTGSQLDLGGFLALACRQRPIWVCSGLPRKSHTMLPF